MENRVRNSGPLKMMTGRMGICLNLRSTAVCCVVKPGMMSPSIIADRCGSETRLYDWGTIGGLYMIYKLGDPSVKRD